MKCKLILIFGMLVVVILVRADLASDLEALGGDMPDFKEITKTEYGFNHKLTEYSDNTGNTIIGGQMYADSTGTKIENAKSLKTCEFCDNIKLQIDLDKDYTIEVIDYNYTSIQVRPIITKEQIDKKIPLITYDKNNKSDIQLNLSAKYSSEGKVPILTIPFGFDKVVKWGENSTTIKLQLADSENLGDTGVWDWGVDFDRGSCTVIDIKNQSGLGVEWGAFMFNTTIIPLGSQIDNAILYLYLSKNGLDANTNLTVVVNEYQEDNWTEGEQCTNGGCVYPELCWNTFGSYNTTNEDSF